MKKFLIFACLFFSVSMYFVSCSDNDDSDELSQKSAVSELKKGNSIILSESSPMGFGYFIVTGLAEGQWAEREQSTIAPGFSTATFTYVKTGENTYRLESLNRQIISSGIRYWSITLDLTFTSHKSGTYVLRDVSSTSGTSYTTRGSFEIK